MPWLAAGAAAAGLAGSVIGANEKSNAREEAGRLINQSVGELTAIGIPPEEAMKLSLEKYRSAGLLTPEMESDILQGNSEMGGITTDPRLQDAEMAALDELRRTGESGGLRAADQAKLENVMSQTAQAERGSREAILMDAAQRGASTGGGAIAAQLANQQGAAQRNHMGGVEIAGQAQDAALQAILQSGQLAGSMQGRQFEQAAQKAKAQDLINQMNTQARQGVMQRNVGSRNAAQQYNLQNQQNLMNSNVDIGNKEQVYNKSLPQQTFNNQLALGAAKANARSGQATNVMQGGQDAANMWGSIGGAVANAGTGIYNSQQKSEEAEKDRQNRKDIAAMYYGR